MKQILQNLSNGETALADVPCPAPVKGQLLIRSSVTLVSAGTERMLVEFGKANWLEKARSQPDKVKMVLEKIKTDGLLTTLDAVKSKLDQPIPLGYCNVGTIVESGGTELQIGERVVSNGGHAEIVRVPRNLCVKVPEQVDDDSASFTVLGAIALQGVRLAAPTIGESVVVIGLGLVGLITVQILRANGCRVLGVDFDNDRLKLAKGFGAEIVNPGERTDVVSAAVEFSRGRGVDAVLITASTKSSQPVHDAANMSRKRGRIVLVGVTGLELSRADFYEKELTFQVSCSYGPGRYDSEYEERGRDYPLAFVRWTEQRNFEAVLDLMASGKLDMRPLISHRYAFSDAVEAYKLLGASEPSLGILLEYNDAEEVTQRQSERAVEITAHSFSPSSATVGFLGSGNYAGRVLIPAFKNSGAQIRSIVSSGGISARHYAKKFGAAIASTDVQVLLDDENVGVVVVATRHDRHSEQVIAALNSRKHVFCEKPLCLTLEELAAIETVAKRNPDLHLMVGFNRRFAPHIKQIKKHLAEVTEQKVMVMTVNAGAIPADHWTQDRAVGGGRIIGEGCHFIDLLRHLSGSKIAEFDVSALMAAGSVIEEDKAVLTLKFEDGSLGIVNYLANGHKSFPKERLEVFCGGRILQLDNFRQLHSFGWSRVKPEKLWRQDKGQRACAQAFIDAIKNGGCTPIAREEIFEVSRVSIEIANLLR